MRVLAARFPDRRIASAVRDVLRRRLHLDQPDVDIAPLWVPGDRSENDTILAGRFPDSEAAEVVEVVRDAGGEIAADVDERWTRPRSDVRSRTWNPAYGRGGLNA